MTTMVLITSFHDAASYMLIGRLEKLQNIILYIIDDYPISLRTRYERDLHFSPIELHQSIF